MSPSATSSNGKNGHGHSLPETQTAAIVRELGGQVEFDENYPVPKPGRNEVLAKVLYTGVCQSGPFLIPGILSPLWRSYQKSDRVQQISTPNQAPQPAPTATPS